MLIESNKTFEGKDKPYIFEENKQSFAAYMHKVIHIKVDDMPEGSNPWLREAHQRNQIKRIYSQCNDNDIVLIGDVDEIPKKEKLDAIFARLDSEYNNLILMNQRCYKFFMNRDEGGPWRGTLALNFKTLKARDPETWRLGRYDFLDGTNLVEDCGWHFSGCGGREFFCLS